MTDEAIVEQVNDQNKQPVKPTPPPLYFVYYRPTPDWPTVAETWMEANRIYKLALAEYESRAFALREGQLNNQQ